MEKSVFEKQIHKHLFTVTPFSKITAVIVFTVLPFVAFYLGIIAGQSIEKSGNTGMKVNNIVITPTTTINSTSSAVVFSSQYLNGTVSSNWTISTKKSDPSRLKSLKDYKICTSDIYSASYINSENVSTLESEGPFKFGVDIYECTTSATVLETAAMTVGPAQNGSGYIYTPKSGKEISRFGLQGLQGYFGNPPFGHFEIYLKDKKMILIEANTPLVPTGSEVEFKKVNSEMLSKFSQNIKFK